MKILIFTDTTKDQVNGVVFTLRNTVDNLKELGVETKIISTDMFFNFSLPFYKEIKLSIPNIFKILGIVFCFNPTHIHVVTEGPIGWIGILMSFIFNCKLSSCYHTKFPEYLHKISKLPLTLSYLYMLLFHSFSSNVLVATKTLKKDLEKKNFKNIKIWSRGVDIDLFKPKVKNNKVKKFLYVGRVSPEKNIEDFLSLKTNGEKHVVGDGPSLNNLKEKYKDVIFHGEKRGVDLSEIYSDCDIFVFPSKTDTFGLVILEAMASGLPVAAYDVNGPKDIIENGVSGFTDNNLAVAIEKTENIKNNRSREIICNKYSWLENTKSFINNLK
jgi:glycosyltransferase involved in cell wall biosynthesis